MRKRPKLLTSIDPIEELDRRVRRYLEKHQSATYDLKTVKAVLKANPELARSYHYEPRFRDLRFLADFLNTAENKELREELLTDVRPLLEKRPLAAPDLAEKLNSISFAVRFTPLLDLKTKNVTRFSSRLVAVDASERAQIYATLASAIQRRDLSRLKQCRACEDFIVALDHRIVYCDKSQCQNAKEDAKKERSKQSMQKKRESERQASVSKRVSPLERFLEFMRLQRKANPSRDEVEKTYPVWRALGGVNAGRKLIAGWEKKYDLKGSFQPWKLKRVWNTELTEQQREIFSSH